MISVPPDVTPEEGGQYLYAMFIRGSGYDINNDTYDSLVVDGVTYSVGGSALLNTDLGDPVSSIVADATAAGIYNATNVVGYYGNGVMDGYILYNWIFTIVTDAPHTISVNVTLSGTPTNIPITGGAFTMQNYCATANVVDTQAANNYYQFMKNEVGGNDEVYWGSAPIFSDNVSMLAGLNLYLNTDVNQLNLLIPYTVNYTDNGDGTYTQTISAPSAYSYPKRIDGVDIGALTYTPC